VKKTQFDRQVAHVRREIQDAEDLSQAGGTDAAELFETLRNTLEELQVTGEELREQNELLAESARVVEVDRARYRDLFDSAPYGFLSTNSGGIIQNGNDAVCRMLKTAPNMLLRKPVSIFVPLNHRKLFRSKLNQISKKERLNSWEQLLRPRKGKDFLALITVLAVEDSDKALSLHWQLHDITQRKRSEDMLRKTQVALERSEEGIRFLAARLISAQEQERRRISRELHDDFSQRLAMLALESETLERHESLPPDVREKICKLRIQMGDLSDSVHRLAYQLHPSFLDDLGLRIALESYISDFNRREGIQTKFTAGNIPKSLPMDISLCLYRVAQECLRNIAKHSQAKRASVKLELSDRSIRLLIKDSGIGFDTEALRSGKGGLGIVSIGERVRLLKGKIQLVSAPNKGTKVEVTLPLSKTP
jgi:PAS domain S-box-containing protein